MMSGGHPAPPLSLRDNMSKALWDKQAPARGEEAAVVEVEAAPKKKAAKKAAK